MWIILNDAVLSLVENQKRTSTLLVRSRLPEDINRVFPDAVVWETTDSDYRYRTVVPKKLAGELLASKIEEINYSNFKDSVGEDDRHDVYTRVWSELSELQPLTKRATLPPCALVEIPGENGGPAISKVIHLDEAMSQGYKILSKNPSDFI